MQNFNLFYQQTTRMHVHIKRYKDNYGFVYEVSHHQKETEES